MITRREQRRCLTFNVSENIPQKQAIIVKGSHLVNHKIGWLVGWLVDKCIYLQPQSQCNQSLMQRKYVIKTRSWKGQIQVSQEWFI